jgi:hypothetical protein
MIIDLPKLRFIPISKHQFCTESISYCRKFTVTDTSNTMIFQIISKQEVLGIMNTATYIINKYTKKKGPEVVPRRILDFTIYKNERVPEI